MGALDVLMDAIKKSGHAEKVKIGTDVAASEFYDEKTKLYNLDFKNPSAAADMKMTASALIDYYQKWIDKYPLVSIEDPFDQDDFEAYGKMPASLGEKCQVVGDDLLVTNPKRVQKGIDEKACNALLLKVNRIGSVSEAIEACKMSQAQTWGVMVSHRSGETEDTFIADLVVGLRTGQIKTGAPCRSERLAKYNQLLRIEEEIGSLGRYAGVGFRNVGSFGKTVCITGAGNAAHVFIPYFVNQGFEVTVFASFKDEAERLQKGCDENGGITIFDRQDPSNTFEYKGMPKAISKHAADVIPQADYIIAALPSFAIGPTLSAIKDHLKQGSIIFVMPGQGGADFVAREVLKDELASGRTTVAGVVPMPLNCRIDEWGKRVQLASLKHLYWAATLPPKNAEVAASALQSLMDKPVNVIGNYVGINLHCSNPNLHPGRLYRMWSGYTEGTVYPENPLFYETWDEESTEWLMKINAERMNIWRTIAEKYPEALSLNQFTDMKDYIKDIYGPQVKDGSTFTTTITSCDGYKGFRCPMKAVEGGWVPDFANRYFSEDLPEGVAMYKGIADLAGVETPIIDEIVCHFQKFMGKEYIKDGKLAGKDVGETKSPQRYGITSLEDLLRH